MSLFVLFVLGVEGFILQEFVVVLLLVVGKKLVTILLDVLLPVGFLLVFWLSLGLLQFGEGGHIHPHVLILDNVPGSRSFARILFEQDTDQLVHLLRVLVANFRHRIVGDLVCQG